jgi:hypothetical protein
MMGKDYELVPRTVQQTVNLTDILMFRPTSVVAFRELFEPKVSEHFLSSYISYIPL